MATAVQKNSSPASPDRTDGPTSIADRIGRGFDAIYRFLASVKLAVLSLSALAGTLAYATFFEKWYGTAAVNEYIYRGPGFAILLAFLGINILCAALIRFPWKKRQTGFVITHAGLITILIGSYYSVRTSDEGQVGMLEGDVRSELVRMDHPVLRVWQVDPHTQQFTREYIVPFLPGSFSWGPGHPRPSGLVGRLKALVPGLGSNATDEVLTRSDDPFRIVAKEFLAASIPATEHVESPSGTPMARIRVLFKAPGMPEARDAFPTDESQWFLTDSRFFKAVREPMRAAPAVVSFSAVDHPDLVKDFLEPPAGNGPRGVARFRYEDSAGKPRVYDWPLDGEVGKTTTLPGSDLAVTLAEVLDFPTQERGLDRVMGPDPVPLAVFKIRKGKAEEVTHMAMANLPRMPNVIPPSEKDAKPPAPLALIHYIVRPSIDPKTNGRFGEIDVLAGPDQRLYYRIFGRAKEGGLGELRAAGPLKKGEPIVAFGGTPNMPMTISFAVPEYLPSGIEREVCQPVELPAGKMDQGIAACRVEMTVGDETREIWLRRSTGLDQPRPEFVTFKGGPYALAFDADRKPLGFELKLKDFEVGFEPGTQQPTKFESKVLLTDKAAGLHDEEHLIEMNHPMDHNGYTFYQMRYQPDIDPQSGRSTGRFQSVFQVATNPGRPIIYLGCLLVVVGTFVQFYMRAGVFTDGGKKERERSAVRSASEVVEDSRKPAEPAEQL